jgi:hypothetical protein
MLFNHIADADDDSATIHCRGCNPSSSVDEIGGRWMQGWFWRLIGVAGGDYGLGFVERRIDDAPHL